MDSQRSLEDLPPLELPSPDQKLTRLNSTNMDPEVLKKKILDNAYGVAAPLNAGTITFGCELEFVFMYPRPFQDKQEYSVKHGVDLIRDALRKPQDVTCASCKKDFEFKLSVTSAVGHYYHKWQVGQDESVLPEPDDLKCLGNSWQTAQFQFEPIEIRSRILRYDESAERANLPGGHEHWIAPWDEIHLATSLLKAEFGFGRKDVTDSRYHIFPTRQSGLHVHVANGERMSVPFNTAKKVYSMFVACERQLDRLVGTRDINGINLATEPPKKPISGTSEMWDYMLQSTYNQPISAYLITAAHMRRQWESGPAGKPLSRSLAGDKFILDDLYPQTASKVLKDSDELKFGTNIDSWLALVNGAEDSVDLRGLNCIKDKYCTLNMRHFPSARPMPSPMRGPMEVPVISKLLTIEFRQHAGSLNAPEILSFIDFVVQLVLWCHDTEDEEFHKLLQPGGKLRRPGLSALQLLQFLGCRQETLNFYESHISNTDNPVTKQLDREEENILKYKSQIPVADYALSQIKRRRESIDPQNVEKLIAQKLLTGGYGKFSKDDLDYLLPAGTSSKTREKLAIGYRAPLKFENDGEDQDDWLPDLFQGKLRT